jgi:hypothetical protein
MLYGSALQIIYGMVERRINITDVQSIHLWIDALAGLDYTTAPTSRSSAQVTCKENEEEEEEKDTML